MEIVAKRDCLETETGPGQTTHTPPEEVVYIEGDKGPIVPSSLELAIAADASSADYHKLRIMFA